MRNIHIILTFFVLHLAYAQEYCAGELISTTHQQTEFFECYPEGCDCEDESQQSTWKLADYSGDIIFLDLSAAWCAPCFASIPYLDELESYWHDRDSNVKFVTALADIGYPYSCDQWGNAGITGSPLIVNDAEYKLFDWFGDSNQQYPSFVLIDHEMRVRGKPSSFYSNSNTVICDGGGANSLDGWSGGCINSFIDQLLEEKYVAEGSQDICNDASACNDGDTGSCRYAETNYDCCGNCAVEEDCAGVCGGNTPDEDCADTEINCANCTIVTPDLTIQSAIDAAAPGDTIIVEKGYYVENLIINKNLTLASRALFDTEDELATWFSYTGDGYEVSNDNIVETIIDGSGGEGSVILINSLGFECIEVEIFGLTIQGGSGTLGTYINEDGEEATEILGGGILFNDAIPTINYNYIKDCGLCNNTRAGACANSGGALNGGSGIDFPENQQRYTGTRNCAFAELDLSNNFYSGNDAVYGNTLSTIGFDGTLNMTESVFDVYNCPEQAVTTVWVDVEENVDVDFDNSVGELCSITEDVWVSPHGSDDNLGTSEVDAFLTIKRALEMIAPEDDDPITIQLTEGTISPETEEVFPIQLISNVDIVGQGEEITIIDAQQIDQVFKVYHCKNSSISDLTITGGGRQERATYFDQDFFGGGLRLYKSDIVLSNLHIRNNEAQYGGAIYMNASNPPMTNITIYENSTRSINSEQINEGMNYGGCAIRLYQSSPTMAHIIVRDNTNDMSSFIDGAYDSAGLCLQQSDPVMVDIIIQNNHSHSPIAAAWNSGAIILWNSNPTITNALIIGNQTFENPSGIDVNNSSPIITNATFSENNSYLSGAVIHKGWLSSPVFTNTIMWNNGYSSTSFSYEGENNYPVVNYSNIFGGLITVGNNGYYGIAGEANIESNPQFTDPQNDDFTLQFDSPSIDSGDPNLWYVDIDGTTSDMGYTGGSFIQPSFLSYDFGEVGLNGAYIDFTLHNFRDYPITINSVDFFDVYELPSNSFSTSTMFPLEIFPNESGIITIKSQPEYFGNTEANMILYSSELPEGVTVEVFAIGKDINSLSGSLFGTLDSKDYTIVGDIFVEETNTLILQPGTKFLFDGNYNFIVDGIIQAQGTEIDSIIFAGTDFCIDGCTECSCPDCSLNHSPFCFGDGSCGWWGPSCDEGALEEYCPWLEECILCWTPECNSNLTSWQGITLNNQTSASIFEYVRISNVHRFDGSGRGGAIYFISSEPTFNHVTISNNQNSFRGAGIFMEYSNPTMNNIVIQGNIIDNWGGGYGAGMYLNSSNPTLNNMVFIDNVNVYYQDNPDYLFDRGGGGLYLEHSDPIITNSAFINNTAMNGAGIFARRSGASFSNIIFADNHSFYDGAAIYFGADNHSLLTNITIAENGLLNEDGSGDPVCGDGYCNGYETYENCPDCSAGSILFVDKSYIHFTNSIFWGNDINYNTSLFTSHQSDITIEYSDIQGGWDGLGNINIDPEFICNDCNDFHLQIASPCIDAGDPESVLDPDGSIADMGALYFDQIENPILWGCIDILACENYNENANKDDGSCIYVDCSGVCGGDDSSCADECGVHYGDNTSCADECGVPNGDNTVCADCCGIPNGDGTACSGTCGPCYDDISCCYELDDCQNCVLNEGDNIEYNLIDLHALFYWSFSNHIQSELLPAQIAFSSSYNVNFDSLRITGYVLKSDWYNKRPRDLELILNGSDVICSWTHPQAGGCSENGVDHLNGHNAACEYNVAHSYSSCYFTESIYFTDINTLTLKTINAWTSYGVLLEDFKLNTSHMEDECGICDGDDSSCADDFNCFDNPEGVGDLNGDYSYNILDLTTLIFCVMDQTCDDCRGDINGDGSFNILDIVGLSNCILYDNCDDI